MLNLCGNVRKAMWPETVSESSTAGVEMTEVKRVDHTAHRLV